MTAKHFKLVRCHTAEDLIPIHEMREKVLFEGRSYDRNHGDDKNPSNHNFLFFKEEKPVATARLDFIAPNEIAVRLVAVLPEYQGQGIGSQLLSALEHYAKERHIKKLVTNARKGAEGFYKTNGYIFESWADPGEGISIPTIAMTKYL